MMVQNPNKISNGGRHPHIDRVSGQQPCVRATMLPRSGQTGVCSCDIARHHAPIFWNTQEEHSLNPFRMFRYSPGLQHAPWILAPVSKLSSSGDTRRTYRLINLWLECTESTRSRKETEKLFRYLYCVM